MHGGHVMDCLEQIGREWIRGEVKPTGRLGCVLHVRARAAMCVHTCVPLALGPNSCNPLRKIKEAMTYYDTKSGLPVLNESLNFPANGDTGYSGPPPTFQAPHVSALENRSAIGLQGHGAPPGCTKPRSAEPRLCDGWVLEALLYHLHYPAEFSRCHRPSP